MINRQDIDKYMSDISTVKYSNILITKIGLMENNPSQYYEYESNERHDYCIQYVFTGEGYFFTNKTLYQIKKGDVFYLPRNSEHYYKANPTNPYGYYWIHFNGNGFEKYLSLLGLNDDHPVIENLYDEEIVAVFEEIIECSKNPSDENELLLLSLGYKLLQLLARKAEVKSEIQKSGVNDELASQVTNYIIENFKKDITLEDIAKKVVMDKFCLLKTYKKVTGVTPIQFLINYRIEYACFLLKQGYRINEVAYECGFNDISNFSVRFKKVIGVPPSKFGK